MVVLQCSATPIASDAVQYYGVQHKEPMSWTKPVKQTLVRIALGRDGLHVQVVP